MFMTAVLSPGVQAVVPPGDCGTAGTIKESAHNWACRCIHKSNGSCLTILSNDMIIIYGWHFVIAGFDSEHENV